MATLRQSLQVLYSAGLRGGWEAGLDRMRVGSVGLRGLNNLTRFEAPPLPPPPASL
jgi:hypothetical protein